MSRMVSGHEYSKIEPAKEKGSYNCLGKKGVCRIAADIPIKLKILIYSFV